MLGKDVFYKELIQLFVTHFSVRLQKYRSSSSSCDWNVSPLILPPGIQMTAPFLWNADSIWKALDFFSNAGFGMVKQTKVVANNHLPHSSECQMSNLVKGQDEKKLWLMSFNWFLFARNPHPNKVWSADYIFFQEKKKLFLINGFFFNT